jgi:hypothetical protein
MRFFPLGQREMKLMLAFLIRRFMLGLLTYVFQKRPQ